MGIAGPSCQHYKETLELWLCWCMSSLLLGGDSGSVSESGKQACAHHCDVIPFGCAYRSLDLSDNALGEKGVRACGAAIESQVRPGSLLMLYCVGLPLL